MKLIALMSALVLTDTTIDSRMPAHSMRTEQIAMNEGKASIEVYTDGDRESLNCIFTHANSLVAQQFHVKHCFVITNNTSLPYYLNVLIVNNESHPIHYTVKAATMLPLK